MRTNVPTPAKSSSPASVVPGSRPLASQAAASQLVLGGQRVGDDLLQEVGARGGIRLGP